MYSPADAPKAATSSPSATSAPFVTPSSSPDPGQDRHVFPKERRILRRADFRKVYDEGAKFTCPYFAAFYLRWPDQEVGPRVGFTVSKALGKAVVRNRMRRRIREAVRLHLNELDAQWAVVFNPRKASLEAPFPELEHEVQRLFGRCRKAQS